MFEAFLATTSSDGLQPLGTAAQRSWNLVTSVLRARLGEEHANLFAEPVASEHGDRIDWHAAVPGKAVQLADLPEAERQGLRNRLGALVGDIRAEAQGLSLTGGAEDQRLSEALLNALEIPGEAMIWAVRSDGGALQPVLVHWAWVRNEQRAVRGILTGPVPRLATATDAVGPQGRALPWGWLIGLGWLLLTGLLGAILWLVLAPCGLNPAGPDTCPGDEPAQAAAFAEAVVIADEIAALERAVALNQRTCQPTIPIRPAPQQQGSAGPGGIEARLAGQGAALGALNFVLEWRGRSDLDLLVTCPSGETVSQSDPAACDATFDRQANADPDSARDDPLENIVFADAKPGIYKVRVHLREARSGGDTTLILHILRRGAVPQSHAGTVTQDADWTMNMSISR